MLTLANTLTDAAGTADAGTAVAIDFAARDALGDPIDWEGDCRGCPGTYLLDTAGRLPMHKVAGGRTDRPHCAGSGEPGRAPRRARYFYVEGGHYL